MRLPAGGHSALLWVQGIGVQEGQDLDICANSDADGSAPPRRIGGLQHSGMVQHRHTDLHSGGAAIPDDHSNQQVLYQTEFQVVHQVRGL